MRAWDNMRVGLLARIQGQPQTALRTGSCKTGKSTFTPGRFMFFFSPMAMSFITLPEVRPCGHAAHQQAPRLGDHMIAPAALDFQGEGAVGSQNDAAFKESHQHNKAALPGLTAVGNCWYDTAKVVSSP